MGLGINMVSKISMLKIEGQEAVIWVVCWSWWLFV